jgi:uracil-DNA glycosylase family 4
MNCKGCGRHIIEPEGPPDAEILIVGDAPNQYDMHTGHLWTGEFGDLLRAELRKLGILYKNCRVTNLWQHPKDKDCDFEKYHINTVLREMDSRPVVLLLGADAVSYFTGYGVSDVSGLRVDTLPRREYLIPASVGKAFALFNPAIVLHEKLGELRHGLTKYAEAIR